MVAAVVLASDAVEGFHVDGNDGHLGERLDSEGILGHAATRTSLEHAFQGHDQLRTSRHIMREYLAVVSVY